MSDWSSGTNRLTTDDLAKGPVIVDEETQADRDTSVSSHVTGSVDASDTHDSRGPLLPADEIDDFSGRWSEIQTRFVDEPRSAVKDADSMVAELMQRLATMFSQERETLESQWSRGDDVSTEDLRLALQRYRSFFQRLLAA